MSDCNATFAVQKLCEVIKSEQRRILMFVLAANRKSVIEHPNSCHVLQKFIETSDPSIVDQLFVALKDVFLDLCLSPNGNHVAQRFVEMLPRRQREIVEIVRPHVARLLVDNAGCRVVQKLFEAGELPVLDPLVKEVIRNAAVLATNQYGNYVVQKIMGSANRSFVAGFAKMLSGRFYELSTHKFASNVVEMCITTCPRDEKMRIFGEILGTADFEDRLMKMVTDKFGNYVIQRIIEHGTEEQQTVIYEVIYDNYDRLSGCPYARFVITLLHDLGFEF
jgi:hypothetical protein